MSSSRRPRRKRFRAAATDERIFTLNEIGGAAAAMRAQCVAADIDVPLTQREAEVLRELVKGLTNKDIAKIRQISYETVKEHVQHSLRKISVIDRTQAAVWAVRKGLV